MVREAEDEEVQRFKKMGVYDYVDRQTAHQDGEVIFVKVKWVRVSKGTKTNPHAVLTQMGVAAVWVSS